MPTLLHTIRPRRVTTSLAVAFVLGAMPPVLAGPLDASADPVLFWNDVLLASVREARSSPPVASRGMALVHVAMHDAVNAAVGSPGRGYLGTLALPIGNARAAASVAARDVLATLYPARTAAFDTALAQSLALVPDVLGEARGLAIGSATASAVIERRRGDGSDDVVAYAPDAGPGGWQPTPPAFASPQLPQWPSVTPWVMSAGDQFRPPAPPPLNSVGYADAYNEVRGLGVAEGSLRTTEQTETALYWADGAGTATPPGHWLAIASDVAEARGLSTIENARLFGRMAVSMADAAIAAWDAKYAYDLWRPVTAIRRGDGDGNAATSADPDWTPLIATPPFPAYPSGHSAFSAAAARVLARSLGDDTGFCSSQDGVAEPLTRCWSSFSQAAAEAGRSRIYGGIHWSFDNGTGQAAGAAIGDLAYGTLFVPVPEPATISLLSAILVGLGFARRPAPWRNRTARSGAAERTLSSRLLACPVSWCRSRQRRGAHTTGLRARRWCG